MIQRKIVVLCCFPDRQENFQSAWDTSSLVYSSLPTSAHGEMPGVRADNCFPQRPRPAPWGFFFGLMNRWEIRPDFFTVDFITCSFAWKDSQQWWFIAEKKQRYARFCPPKWAWYNWSKQLNMDKQKRHGYVLAVTTRDEISGWQHLDPKKLEHAKVEERLKQ
jgi:hypothetical protein